MLHFDEAGDIITPTWHNRGSAPALTADGTFRAIRNSTASLRTDDLFVPHLWREPLQWVLAGMAERCPVILLVSAEGRGKTTFLACLGPAASVLAAPTEVFVIDGLKTSRWLASLAAAFDLGNGDDGDEAALHEAVVARLAQRAGQGAQLIVAVDDADRLPPPALEGLLAFARGWVAGEAPISFLLTGTSDLSERVAAVIGPRGMHGVPRFSLTPWGLDDITAFIRHRLARQERDRRRFSPEAISRIYELSAGEPATVTRMAIRSLKFAEDVGEAEIGRMAVDYAATSLVTDPDDSPVRERQPFLLPEQSLSTGAPGLAEGLGPPPPLTPRLPADYAPFAGGIAATPSLRREPNAGLNYRRLIPLSLVLVAGGIVGWALWSEGQGERPVGERRIVSVPPMSTESAAATSAAAAGGRAEVPSAATAAVTVAPTTPAPPPLGATKPDRQGAALSMQDAGPQAIEAAPMTESAGIGDLIGRGDALMRLSDVASARQFYLLAVRKGTPGAVTSVGETYDPVFLEESGVRGARGDARQALEWYRNAVRQRETLARSRLMALVAYLQAQGEIDHLEAQRLLEDGS